MAAAERRSAGEWSPLMRAIVCFALLPCGRLIGRSIGRSVGRSGGSGSCAQHEVAGSCAQHEIAGSL